MPEQEEQPCVHDQAPPHRTQGFHKTVPNPHSDKTSCLVGFYTIDLKNKFLRPDVIIFDPILTFMKFDHRGIKWNKRVSPAPRVSPAQGIARSNWPPWGGGSDFMGKHVFQTC